MADGHFDSQTASTARSIGRGFLIAIWLVATAAAGLLLALYAWFIESEIAYRIGDHSQLTLPLLVLGTALAWAAGPLGVWLFRRTRPWLIAGIVLLMLGLATSIPKHAAEKVQDEIRAIQVPPTWQLALEEESGYGAPLFGERDSATRIFTSSADTQTTCVEARAVLTSWAQGATVQDRQSPAESAPPCSIYVAHDGLFVDVTVYDPNGWQRHADVMDYRLSPGASGSSYIRLTTTDSSS